MAVSALSSTFIAAANSAIDRSISISTVGNSLFEAKDIFTLEYASDPQISPDGKKIVYIRNSNDIMTDANNKNLWLIDVKSEKQIPLFRMTNNTLKSVGLLTVKKLPLLVT